VHHLTGPENGGQHHVFCDVLDGEGKRIMGANLIATKGDLAPFLVKIDKPPHEAGTNFPLFKHDTATVAVHRPDAAPLPSDRVINLHTRHPDEEPGTTLYHHSFYVVFQETAGVLVQVTTLEETLRSEGEPLVMPLNPEAPLYRFARDHDLGERLTREYVVDHGGQRYEAQIYERGLVYAPLGQPDKIQVIPLEP
jgi:hypothetical protein